MGCHAAIEIIMKSFINLNLKYSWYIAKREKGHKNVYRMWFHFHEMSKHMHIFARKYI